MVVFCPPAGFSTGSDSEDSLAVDVALETLRCDGKDRTSVGKLQALVNQVEVGYAGDPHVCPANCSPNLTFTQIAKKKCKIIRKILSILLARCQSARL